MDTVFRAAFVYGFLLLIFRICGKRTLSQITTFDLILTLIVSEAIQEALVDDDHSLTNAMILIATLVGLDTFLSWSKFRSPFVAKVLEGTPVVIMKDGEMKRAPMDRERIDKNDILEAARELRGIGSIDEISAAVVERNGRITIIPTKGAATHR